CTSASAFLYAATSTSAAAPAVPDGIARSVNSTVAGTRLRGLYIAVRRSSRASGTFEMPIETSPLPCAARPVSLALVISWKREVLPLDPNPTRAALSISGPESYHAARDGVRPGADRVLTPVSPHR